MCHEWNTLAHLADHEANPARRPLTREELQRFFDYADDRVERAIKLGRKGALTAYRDATLFKAIYGWDLRCTENSKLDVTDFYRNPHAPELGQLGGVHVRYGKASRGSPPKRRMVATVMPWAAECVKDYLTNVRPRFTAAAENPALWLHNRGKAIGTCTQSDIDQWLADGPATGNPGRNFLRWASTNGYAHGINVPTHPQGRLRAELTPEDQRWTLVRTLLHDNKLAPRDRSAGLLLLLYGQSLTRISQLTTNDVNDTGDTLQLRLGTTPVDLPPPLDNLVRQLVRTRRGRGEIGHTSEHHWLFPGGAPGHPAAPVTISRHLKKLGIQARPGRNAAMMDLARQLPAAVLSNLLGLHIATAASWTTHADSAHHSYAAHVQRRSIPSEQQQF